MSIHPSSLIVWRSATWCEYDVRPHQLLWRKSRRKNTLQYLLHSRALTVLPVAHRIAIVELNVYVRGVAHLECVRYIYLLQPQIRRVAPLYAAPLLSCSPSSTTQQLALNFSKMFVSFFAGFCSVRTGQLAFFASFCGARLDSISIFASFFVARGGTCRGWGKSAQVDLRTTVKVFWVVFQEEGVVVVRSKEVR